ncbi:uncharacterized protein CMU_039800 [Cryptosporidium muris RN66]|uniref:SCP domain-containing protein n=1 Tax=Cryptosporidium muris (strain RN66) TaxID=441375 RepID=B6A9M0_CRYMR|nr:uncharacterized protein CMU_039800 [Cryptosporidium muris RN66]EEA04911.1 hypothetical protein, conserved [Cryptosporidium muris RN66]|eukprot:XP_002139260.1 hypothetical protein [Cryptosporidium muris RN66]
MCSILISVVLVISVLPENILAQRNIMTDEFRLKLLKAHNNLRSQEAVSATFMLKLAYDYSLEGYAANWGMKCMNGQFQHSPEQWPYRASPGENLYATTLDVSQDPSWDPSSVVKSWWKERENFNWSTGQPNSGYPVGHWTQVVRAPTSTVGCAVVVQCPGSWKTYVICHYDFGNVGFIPYPNFSINPSLPQRPCSQCPNGYNCCENNLCVGIINPNVSPPGPLPLQTNNGVCNEYMMRLCNIRNGACPQRCLDLNYPPIKDGLIVQQCTCTNGNSNIPPTAAWQFKLWYNRGVCSTAIGEASSSLEMFKGLADISAHSVNTEIPTKRMSHTSKSLLSNRFSRDLNWHNSEQITVEHQIHGPGIIITELEDDQNEKEIPTVAINKQTSDCNNSYCENKPNKSNSMQTEQKESNTYSEVSSARIRKLANGHQEAIL